MDLLELLKQPKNIKKLELSLPQGRLIAIGDIHGCVGELELLLNKLNITESDAVIFLGDLVDRGPSSGLVVELIAELCRLGNYYCVQGNHDNKHVRYTRHEYIKNNDSSYKNPMKPNETFLQAHSQLNMNNLVFLATLPHAIVVYNSITEGVYRTGFVPIYCFVHAGLAPSMFKQDPQAFIRNRYFIEKYSKLMPAKTYCIDNQWYVPEGAKPWYEYYSQPFTTVYGHAVHSEPLVVNKTIGIDTGCCFGGKLTAVVFEGSRHEFCCVPAKTCYSSNHG